MILVKQPEEQKKGQSHKLKPFSNQLMLSEFTSKKLTMTSCHVLHFKSISTTKKKKDKVFESSTPTPIINGTTSPTMSPTYIFLFRPYYTTPQVVQKILMDPLVHTILNNNPLIKHRHNFSLENAMVCPNQNQILIPLQKIFNPLQTKTKLLQEILQDPNHHLLLEISNSSILFFMMSMYPNRKTKSTK